MRFTEHLLSSTELEWAHSETNHILADLRHLESEVKINV